MALDKLHETLQYVYLRWATSGCYEEDDDVRKERKSTVLVSAGERIRGNPVYSTVSTLHVA